MNRLRELLADYWEVLLIALDLALIAVVFWVVVKAKPV